jgi:hypothetical protein
MTMIVSGSDGLTFPNGTVQVSSGTNATAITTGILAVAQGGTGLSSVGTNGNFLQSNGTAWVSAANPPPFVSGTLMLFQQTAAPTGWTKQTTHDNKALRVVSGSASSGGSVGFTTAFASQAVAGTVSTSVDNTTATNQNTTAGGSVSVSLAGGGSVSGTTLGTSEIPSHQHFLNAYPNAPTAQGFGFNPTGNISGQTADNNRVTQATGGGGSHSHGFTNPSYSGSFTGTAHSHTQNAHNHTASSAFTGTAINLAVSYVDLIIASKD